MARVRPTRRELPRQTFFVVWLGHPESKDDERCRKTSPSERPAAQAAFAKKAANVKAAKATTSALALDLIEANQALAAKPLARGEHDDRSVHAAGAPPARLGAHLLSKREVLAIANVTLSDPLVVDAPGHVPALARGRRQVDVGLDRDRGMDGRAAAMPFEKGTHHRRRRIPGTAKIRACARSRRRITVHDPPSPLSVGPHAIASLSPTQNCL